MSYIEKSIVASWLTIGNVLCRLGLMFASVCVWEIRGMAVEAAVKPKALEIAYGPFVDWVDRTTVTISWDVDEAMSGLVRWSMPDVESRLIYQLSSRVSVTS